LVKSAFFWEKSQFSHGFPRFLLIPHLSTLLELFYDGPHEACDADVAEGMWPYQNANVIKTYQSGDKTGLNHLTIERWDMLVQNHTKWWRLDLNTNTWYI